MNALHRWAVSLTYMAQVVHWVQHPEEFQSRVRAVDGVLTDLQRARLARAMRRRMTALRGPSAPVPVCILGTNEPGGWHRTPLYWPSGPCLDSRLGAP